MARIKLDIPEPFEYSTELTVRITDVNYGGHMGNDALLSILHEARVRYLNHHGYSEVDVEGCGMIMTDAVLVFSSQAYAGDPLVIRVAPANPSRTGCDFFYLVMHKDTGKEIARAKTGNAFYDYDQKRIMKIPEPFKALCVAGS